MNRITFKTPWIAIFLFWGCLCSVPRLIQAEKISVSSIAPEELVGFAEQSPEIQALIRTSLSLTRKNLAYSFGSNSPSNGGMDCSGTVQHTLSKLGITNLPRTSFDFYQWIKTSSEIHSTRKIYEVSDPAFSELKPGDLLFWEGTYNAAQNDPPVSHVMIYLGKLKKDGVGVMYGASSGRRYRGKKIHGVSVFDFKIPSKKSAAKFIGYGSIPGLSKNTEDTTTARSKKTKVKKTLLEWLGFKKKSSTTKKITINTPPVSPSTPPTSNNDFPPSSEKPTSTEQ